MSPKIKENVSQLKSEVKKQITTMLTAAFGFVAALSWNDAIKAMITSLIGTADAWPYMLLNAVVVTVIVVIAVLLISRYTK